MVDTRLLVNVVAFGPVVYAQWQMGRWVRHSASGWLRPLLVAEYAWLLTGFLFNYHAVNRLVPVPEWFRMWVCGGAYWWAFATTGAFLGYRLWRWIWGRMAPRFDPRRRRALEAVSGAAIAAPFALAGFGTFIQRTDFRVREIDVALPNLPPDLAGLRLVQLSDIHLSPFLSEREFARVVDAANDLRPHVALVTGDLISMAGDPLDACLRQLARLRADAGVTGCLGNHEVYARVQRQATEGGARLGLRFLRGQAEALRFGTATLNLAGVDYQSVSERPRYLQGAERLLAPGAVNVLLSHNPDVFPVAARQGWELTVAGHTHGGQVTVEILHQSINVARFVTPFVYGLYRRGPASLYVTRGIGTIGLPARIGAPPEIAVLRLIRA